MKSGPQGFGRRLGHAERERKKARIIELSEQGLKPGPISKRVGYTAGHVRKVLREAGFGPRGGGAKFC